MPYVRIGSYSQRMTYVRKSPIPGLTWRQYKSVRHYIKRHKRILGGASIRDMLMNQKWVRVLANVISTRKHWWL